MATPPPPTPSNLSALSPTTSLLVTEDDVSLLENLSRTENASDQREANSPIESVSDLAEPVMMMTLPDESTFRIRHNLFQRIQSAPWKAIYLWLFTLIHFGFFIGSVVALALSRHESCQFSPHMRIFISFMSLTSLGRIFVAHYERRYPLVVVTEWGNLVTREVNTVPGKVALFLHKHLNSLCLIGCFFILFAMDKTASECAKEAQILYWFTSFWITFYFVVLVFPIFVLLALITCLPCVIVVLQRFYNIPREGVNRRQEPLTDELLTQVPSAKYRSDPAFEYKITSNDGDSQTIIIPKEDAKCSICLAPYQRDENLRILPCKHHFHKQCADEWFRITATCPLCVRPIIPDRLDSSAV